MPSCAAAETSPSTAGAEVKVTTSTSRAATAAMSRPSRLSSVGRTHRYGATVSTDAPAARSRSSCSTSSCPCSCTATRLPRTPSSRARPTVEAVRSSWAMPSSSWPAARTAPRAFGPRTMMRARSRVRARSSPRPAASAPSIQRRKPYAVVTMTMSGRLSMTARVSPTRISSSSTGAMRTAGAWSTSAPRRTKASMRSSDRRSDVTAIRKPSSTGPLASTRAASVSASFSWADHCVAGCERRPLPSLSVRALSVGALPVGAEPPCSGGSSFTRPHRWGRRRGSRPGGPRPPTAERPHRRR
jgi:hypothetical protein